MLRILVPAALALTALTGWTAYDVAQVRLRRDITRMVFNDNLELLETIRREVGVAADTLAELLADTAAGPPAHGPYLVVSIADNRLWLKDGTATLFETRVATGTGRRMVAGKRQLQFDTPRGRLVVERKDVAPAWVPPDWHYVEYSRKRRLGTVQLTRATPLPVGDGSVVAVSGNDVVRRFPDGREEPFEVAEGKEIIVGGKVVIPPFGTNQRKYPHVLGANRLYLGDGYGIHGTDAPASIGRSASHGCVRVRNEDIETLFRLVPLGTPVYIY
jgi:hypothetical protein